MLQNVLHSSKGDITMASSEIAVLGQGNNLWFFWQSIGTVPWNPELVPGTPGFSAPSLAQVGDSSVIAVQGPGHTLLFYWQSIGAVPWNSEVVATPGTTF